MHDKCTLLLLVVVLMGLCWCVVLMGLCWCVVLMGLCLLCSTDSGVCTDGAVLVCSTDIGV